MALRVQKAQLPAELRDSMIKQLGAVPEPVEVAYNNPSVALANQEFSAMVSTWDSVDASLKTFAHMAVAAQVGCSWCLDVNYFLAQNHDLDLAKASQVPVWRDSEVFTPLERDVLEYAEAMTNTPTTVTDDLHARLLGQLGPAAMVELTVFIGFANMAGRVNTAPGITSQGYSDACEIPLARRPANVRRSAGGMTGADPFAAHRGLLFTVAYEMLGSAADAEDVVQEAWLRWAGADRPQVRDPRSYLIRVVTRQALNRLRTRSRSREDYVGEWLPEPLLTSPDVAEDVELAESVSIAMLTVLETLGPAERAVFVLREVFDLSYGEIASGRREARGDGAADRAAGPRARGGPPAAGAGEPGRAAGRGGAVPGRAAHRAVAGANGRPGTGRGPDRRRRRARGHCRGPGPRGRSRGEGACARRPERLRVDDRVAQRRAGGQDRGRRQAGRGEPGGGGRPGQPGLPRPEPAQADAAGRADRPCQVSHRPGCGSAAGLRCGPRQTWYAAGHQPRAGARRTRLGGWCFSGVAVRRVS